MVAMSPNRRDTLRLLGGAALGGWFPARLALAAPARTPDPDAPRLVVVMLRGALDGLAAVPAIGDPAWAGARPGAEAPASAAAAPMPLDGFFALHPALVQLHRWYQQGQLLVLHAIASQYRERSHFDAQQLVESGGPQPFALSTGWLGRALQVTGQGAVALTAAMPLALRGAEAASTWTPARGAGDGAGRDDLMARVAELYRDDTALRRAFAQAMGQQQMAMGGGVTDGALGSLARQAGVFLSATDGPRVAWLEADGWDTHTQQAQRLARLLPGLDEGLGGLRDALGPHWARTTVLVITEFGRAVAINGSGGTDHGTAGVAFLAGGAVAGGRVLADWPGLAPARLHEGRDLRPTLDLRSVLAALLQRQFGLGTAQLAGTVLPGVLPATVALWRT